MWHTRWNNFLNLRKIDDELEAIRQFFDSPFRDLFDFYLVHDFTVLFKNENYKDYDEMTFESNRIREEGNRLFNAKHGKRDVLGACRLYTRAIFAAPEDSETLALAHANRAMALQEFGYFRQAYDDCVVALDVGYPKRLRRKIVARQATCSLHFGEVEQAQRHLDDLDDISLPESFAQQVQMQIREPLKELLLLRAQKENKSDKEENINTNDKTNDLQKIKIVQSSGPSGRFMVATKAIGKHEMIFSDYAAAFVPLDGAMLCQQCACAELIPFPCKYCRNRVVYCSLKCLLAHSDIHKFECAGYRINFLGNNPIAHLAFRTMLEGFPQVIPLLRGKRNSKALWAALVGKDNNSIAANKSIAYAHTLHLVHHLNGVDRAARASFIGGCYLLVFYLKKYTDFFKLTEGTAASRRDWELITAALTLRHIGQAITNGTQYVSLSSMYSEHVVDLFNCTLLHDDIWTGPLRAKRGCLHKIHAIQTVALALFPNLSMCNHTCEPSFEPRFSRRNMYALAHGNITSGAEITHCYLADCRESKQQNRQAFLKEIHNFECKCAKCKRANPDCDYKQFQRYRCDNLKCRKIFVADFPQKEDLSHEKLTTINFKPKIKCTICGVEQRFECLENIHKLVRRVPNPNTRLLLYRRFDELNNLFLDKNLEKAKIGHQIVFVCCLAHTAGSRLRDEEFRKLVQIVKFYLSVMEIYRSSFSIHYVTGMTILWDIIAMGKYKCTRDEMQPMLHAIEVLSDEMQTVFMNYYTDYIEPLLL